MPDVELAQEHEVCPVVGFDEVVVVAVGEAGEEVGGEAVVVAADVSAPQFKRNQTESSARAA